LRVTGCKSFDFGSQIWDFGFLEGWILILIRWLMSCSGNILHIISKQKGPIMQKSIIFFLMIILLAPAAAFGDECVEGDCVNGKGTMNYSTGHKFTGEFKDGVRHGEGVLLLPGGRKMVGVWVDNSIREGTFTASDGTIYEGQWEFRERNGRGTLTFPDGRKYIGDFKSDRRHGQGTMIWPDGRKYVGEFNRGARTGQGTMIYADGHKYTGEFKDGEKHGHGTLVSADGTKMVGAFQNGEFVKK
jgi:hypothetical protein